MGNANSINKHIENAQKTGVCQVANMDIKEFPEQLLRLKANLRSLDVSNNMLKSLPDAIGSFAFLRNLNLEGNSINKLPDSIGKLKKLETLSISRNPINKLPASIKSCKSLQTLKASNCLFQTFPAEVIHLGKLDAVDFSHNTIRKIPEDISSITVVEINLNFNKLTILPEALAKCPRLKVFRFQNNAVMVRNVSPLILSTSGISLLVYEGNKFDAKALQGVEGYEKYMDRYTATKKKFD